MGKRTSEALENQYKMILAQCEGNALFVQSIIELRIIMTALNCLLPD
jgi:hypothetical protein